MPKKNKKMPKKNKKIITTKNKKMTKVECCMDVIVQSKETTIARFNEIFSYCRIADFLHFMETGYFHCKGERREWMKPILMRFQRIRSRHAREYARLCRRITLPIDRREEQLAREAAVAFQYGIADRNQSIPDIRLKLDIINKWRNIGLVLQAFCFGTVADFKRILDCKSMDAIDRLLYEHIEDAIEFDVQNYDTLPKNLILHLLNPHYIHSIQVKFDLTASVSNAYAPRLTNVLYSTLRAKHSIIVEYVDWTKVCKNYPTMIAYCIECLLNAISNLRDDSMEICLSILDCLLKVPTKLLHQYINLFNRRCTPLDLVLDSSFRWSYAGAKELILKLLNAGALSKKYSFEARQLVPDRHNRLPDEVTVYYFANERGNCTNFLNTDVNKKCKAYNGDIYNYCETWEPLQLPVVDGLEYGEYARSKGHKVSFARGPCGLEKAIVHRPTSAANGKRIGEASHPGPGNLFHNVVCCGFEKGTIGKIFFDNMMEYLGDFDLGLYGLFLSCSWRITSRGPDGKKIVTAGPARAYLRDKLNLEGNTIFFCYLLRYYNKKMRHNPFDMSYRMFMRRILMDMLYHGPSLRDDKFLANKIFLSLYASWYNNWSLMKRDPNLIRKQMQRSTELIFKSECLYETPYRTNILESRKLKHLHEIPIARFKKKAYIFSGNNCFYDSQDRKVLLKSRPLRIWANCRCYMRNQESYWNQIQSNIVVKFPKKFIKYICEGLHVDTRSLTSVCRGIFYNKNYKKLHEPEGSKKKYSTSTNTSTNDICTFLRTRLAHNGIEPLNSGYFSNISYLFLGQHTSCQNSIFEHVLWSKYLFKHINFKEDHAFNVHINYHSFLSSDKYISLRIHAKNNPLIFSFLSNRYVMNRRRTKTSGTDCNFLEQMAVYVRSEHFKTDNPFTSDIYISKRRMRTDFLTEYNGSNVDNYRRNKNAPVMKGNILECALYFLEEMQNSMCARPLHYLSLNLVNDDKDEHTIDDLVGDFKKFYTSTLEKGEEVYVYNKPSTQDAPFSPYCRGVIEGMSVVKKDGKRVDVKPHRLGGVMYDVSVEGNTRMYFRNELVVINNSNKEWKHWDFMLTRWTGLHSPKVLGVQTYKRLTKKVCCLLRAFDPLHDTLVKHHGRIMEMCIKFNKWHNGIYSFIQHVVPILERVHSMPSTADPNLLHTTSIETKSRTKRRQRILLLRGYEECLSELAVEWAELSTIL